MSMLGGSRRPSAHRAASCPPPCRLQGMRTVTARAQEPGSPGRCLPRPGCLHRSLIIGAQTPGPPSASPSGPLPESSSPPSPTICPGLPPPAPPDHCQALCRQKSFCQPQSMSHGRDGPPSGCQGPGEPLMAGHRHPQTLWRPRPPKRIWLPALPPRLGRGKGAGDPSGL